jgi:hypothetical protein
MRSLRLYLALQKLFYAVDRELRRALDAEDRRQARRQARHLKTALFDAIAQVSGQHQYGNTSALHD